MRKLLKVMSVFALVVLVGLSMAACGGNDTPLLEGELNGLYVNDTNNGEFLYFNAGNYIKGQVYYSESYDEYIVSTNCLTWNTDRKGTIGEYTYNADRECWQVSGINKEHSYYETTFMTEKNSNNFLGTIIEHYENKYTRKTLWSLADFAISYIYETYGEEVYAEDIYVDEELQEYWSL